MFDSAISFRKLRDFFFLIYLMLIGVFGWFILLWPKLTFWVLQFESVIEVANDWFLKGWIFCELYVADEVLTFSLLRIIYVFWFWIKKGTDACPLKGLWQTEIFFWRWIICYEDLPLWVVLSWIEILFLKSWCFFVCSWFDIGLPYWKLMVLLWTVALLFSWRGVKTLNSDPAYTFVLVIFLKEQLDLIEWD